ncbi:MAG TPA: transglutaminase family protein [Tepidisphaeraceae bacterium]|nr:transglutaminase family protein [Tepidisphaeraceae bacterium]
MLLQLTHTTELTYTDLISESVVELRMAPRQESDQHRLSFSLAIGPATAVNSYFDWLGNTVHALSISAFHKQIRIVASSVVETDRLKVEVERFKDQWPGNFVANQQLYDFLQFAGPIVKSQALTDVVKELGAEPGMSQGELALRMLHSIAEKFAYVKGVTTSASSINEILRHGSGVCQDFAHLMIGMARSVGIPARYVSGLVHPDADRFRGYTQTHAWVELLFPSAGWVGFDPTNNCIVGPNFVKVAIGRDYRDVPPNKGVYRGNAQEDIDVKVLSKELKQMPGGLAGERYQTLSVATFSDAGGRTPWDSDGGLQQQQQQQQ